MSEAPLPPRLWMKMPSKVWVRGCEGVGEGREVEGGLRLADGHDVRGVQAAQHATGGARRPRPIWANMSRAYGRRGGGGVP